MGKVVPFNEAEFAQTLDRIKSGKDMVRPQPGFDPKQHQELVAQSADGRKIEDFKQGLERGGFRYVPADRLPPFENGRVQTEGLWKNDYIRKAMTSNEVLAWFKSPEELWTWTQLQRKKRAIQQRL